MPTHHWSRRVVFGHKVLELFVLALKRRQSFRRVHNGSRARFRHHLRDNALALLLFVFVLTVVVAEVIAIEAVQQWVVHEHGLQKLILLERRVAFAIQDQVDLRHRRAIQRHLTQKVHELNRRVRVELARRDLLLERERMRRV
uniref:Uncharacterized protein n=1 Tax=Globisporangium ultimum (strain ATCC 200006 / CBS 805.95 / DAOM BR144) TaxID=431595 RepID=K3WMV0_GLOUD